MSRSAAALDRRYRAAILFAGRQGGVGAVWSGDDLVEVELVGATKAGEKLWMQIDNVEFY